MSDREMNSTQPNTGYKRQSSQQSGTWLRWTSGESKEFQIASVSATRQVRHWIGNSSQDCTGHGCALCAAGARQQIRWTVDCLLGGAPVLWEMSNQVFTMLEDVAEATGTLLGLNVKVIRSGTGRQTRYTIVPLGSSPVEAPSDFDLTGAISYTKTLCTQLGITVKEELARMIAGNPEHFAKKSRSEVMQAFVAHLEGMTNGDEEEKDEVTNEMDALYASF